MLDLIIGPFLEYGPLGDLNKTSVDGKNEVWYNSKIDITFGDTTSWLIGLGRMTNISGPDLKVVSDWSFIFELIPEPTNKALRWGKSLLLGAGGATDLILGGKDSLNYGHTQDISIVRKNESPFEVKIFGNNLNPDEKLLPTSLLSLIIFPYLILLTIVVTSRLAYMQVGKFSEKNLRDQVRGALNMSAPLIESRWVACLILYEKLRHSKDKIQKKVTELQNIITKTLDDNIVALNNAQNLPRNIFITQTLNNKIQKHLGDIRDFNASQVFEQEKAIREATDALKLAVPLLGAPEPQYIESNTNLIANYNSLNYNTIRGIRLEVTGNANASPTKLSLSPRNAFLTTSTAGIIIGEIGPESTKGIINIYSKNDKGHVHLSAQNQFSDIIIRNESLTIQSGTTPNQTPTVELAEGSLKIRCGPALTGPQILFDNDKVKITAGIQEPTQIGPSIVMTNDSIELKVGTLSSLLMTKNGTILKSGLASSTKWDATGISMSVGENGIKLGLADLKKQAIMLQDNIDAVAKIKSVLSNLDVSAIEQTNAALRNLK